MAGFFSLILLSRRRLVCEIPYRLNTSLIFNKLSFFKEKNMKEIDVNELKEMFDSGADFELIDVRMPDEWAISKIEGAKLIPLPEILKRKDEIDTSKPVVVHCKMGGRSARAIQALEQDGVEADMSNLIGGITAWKKLNG